MGVAYTEREAATIHDFVRRRVRARELSPARVSRWGSLVQGSHFSESSDIDLAVEGVADPRKLHELHDELQRMSAFDLDIVRLESLRPYIADHLRRRGRVVYEAAG